MVRLQVCCFYKMIIAKPPVYSIRGFACLDRPTLASVRLNHPAGSDTIPLCNKVRSFVETMRLMAHILKLLQPQGRSDLVAPRRRTC